MAKKYKRGFKAESNRWSNELRNEMGVLLYDPLCPWELAKHLGVPILNLSELKSSPEIMYLFSSKGQSEFSATVCFDGLTAFIICNDLHDPKRQASNIAHELAHILQRHPPTELFNANGNRQFINEYEDEAEWLGPALLVSEDAALFAFKQVDSKRETLTEISERWNITTDVISMRINVVGARKRFSRAA